jgi:hypothetical protein
MPRGEELETAERLDLFFFSALAARTLLLCN